MNREHRTQGLTDVRLRQLASRTRAVLRPAAAIVKPVCCAIMAAGALFLTALPTAQAQAPTQQEQGTPAFTLRLERDFGAAARGDQNRRPLFASGQRISAGADGRMTVEGDAQIRRGGMLIDSDRVEFSNDDEQLDATGSVRVSVAGTVFTGPSLRLNLATGNGRFDSPSYELTVAGGRGTAQSVDFEEGERLVLRGATYSTCSCDDEDWYLKGESLELDNAKGEGKGINTSLYFKGLKLVTLPVFWFPLSNERRSGFLPPSFALTSKSGAEIMVPYYWNIAPNRDLTWFPRIMLRRGLQLGGNYRYLEKDSFGEFSAEYTPNDRLTGDARYQWTLRHNIQRLGKWHGGINLIGISDDNYFVDYGRSIVATSERNLPRDFYLGRQLANWKVLLRATQYRSILDARDAPPYQRLPQLQAKNITRDWHGFDFATLIDATYFTIRKDNSIEGLRAVINPSVSYPIQRAAGFVVPKVGLHMTRYRLNEIAGDNRDITRVLPTFSIDSGLVFERDWHFLGRPVTQTLEPRLFYAWTPYEDQSDIPIFDSGTSEFGFAQLFSANPFVGNDRIADVNELTAALVSRVVATESGVERLRFAVGQRLYFGNQKVTIPGVARRTDKRSDLLLAASGDLGRGISFDSGLQIGLGDTEVQRFHLAWRYWPKSNRIFNLGLRYQRHELGQIDTSFQWPISTRWTALGRVNYSWIDQQLDSSGDLEPTRPGVIESVIGFQYATDCWATRFVVQRFVTAENERTTAFFIQMELNGLGRIGTDPFSILRRNIPGFRLPGEQPQPQDRFSVYQ